MHKNSLSKIFKEAFLPDQFLQCNIILYICISNCATERNPLAGSNGGFEVVSDLERFEEIKDDKFTEVRVGGLWWALDENEQTNTEGKRCSERTLGCGGT